MYNVLLVSYERQYRHLRESVIVTPVLVNNLILNILC